MIWNVFGYDVVLFVVWVDGFVRVTACPRGCVKKNGVFVNGHAIECGSYIQRRRCRVDEYSISFAIPELPHLLKIPKTIIFGSHESLRPQCPHVSVRSRVVGGDNIIGRRLS